MDSSLKQPSIKMYVVYGVIGIVCLMGLFPLSTLYSAWNKKIMGKARLQEAEYTKQILVETARAEKDSASLRAEAIQIMGQAAKDFPEYRKQEFMGSLGEALENGNIDQIIYLPTEAGIPIMEAGRLK